LGKFVLQIDRTQMSEIGLGAVRQQIQQFLHEIIEQLTYYCRFVK